MSSRSLESILVTIRTTKLSEAEVKGKLTKDYQNAAAVVFMCKALMEKLAVGEGENVRLTSDAGSVVVNARESDQIPDGYVAMPFGPWLNLLILPAIDSAGVPAYNGIKVRIERTDEHVKSLDSLF